MAVDNNNLPWSSLTLMIFTDFILHLPSIFLPSVSHHRLPTPLKLISNFLFFCGLQQPLLLHLQFQSSAYSGQTSY
ncbi:hypothetical protein L6452_40414 [Arctium lappa]|uniref:Uncharacterized protein n=1 Tax=Arctium lappa TaxID=4217 RepID=A0ACB8XLB7_ARCLA|nr:hypothetical protein L6452_40414 [Arctium lappa]